MRPSRLPTFLAVAALWASGCADTGAHLTFSAPAGPSVASSFRVVLATPATIPSVQHQRIGLGGNAEQTVSYYLQRTIAGATDDAIDKVDGFTVRIAPDTDFADTEFIPFVLMYDADKQIVGIGTYRASDTTTPSPILVIRDEIDKYKLDVEAVTQVDEMAAAAPGQVRVIECPAEIDRSLFTSGIVWNPQGGGELRLVFPDDGGIDATGRDLDLDCDGHVVAPDDSGPDCDDTRNWFHRDAEDVCDGYDTNCDGQQAIATTCTPSPNTCVRPGSNTLVDGVELCDDRTGNALGCHLPASCLCASGSTTCISCQMPYVAGTATGFASPCQPSIGAMSTYGKCTAAAPCDIDVLGATNGWKVEIAPSTSSSFGSRAKGVGASLVVKAKHPDGSTHEQDVGATKNLSDVSFAFLTATTTEYVTMRLTISEDPAVSTCPASPALTCFP